MPNLKKFEKKIENNINERLINLIVALIGIISVIIGVFLSFLEKGGNEILATVLISVGTSLIASAVVTYLTSIYIYKRKKEKEITDFWGLTAIFETRQRMNDSSDDHLPLIEDSLDIIAFGLRSFRDSKTHEIQNKVRRGLKIRMLTIHPDSPFLKQREIDEKQAEGAIKKSIILLFDWITELRTIAPDENNISIKFYDALPLDFFFRMDDVLFVGPYMYGKDSQQTISMEFRGGANGFNYYMRYFEELWDDKKFPKKLMESPAVKCQ